MFGRTEEEWQQLGYNLIGFMSSQDWVRLELQLDHGKRIIEPCKVKKVTRENIEIQYDNKARIVPISKVVGVEKIVVI